MIRIEIVDPRDHLRAASEVLCESWRPTCIAYTESYLRWHFTFPGRRPALAVMAFEDNTPVAVAAVVPRRLRVADDRFEAYALSFVAVRPAWRGRGISASLYEVLLAEVTRLGASVVTFAINGSAGEHVLKRAYRAAGFHLHQLAPCRGYGYLAPHVASGPGGGQPTREDADVVDATAVVEQCAGDGILWNDPDGDQLRHYGADNERRAVLVARSADGRPVGVALATRMHLVTAQGTETVTSLESVFMPKPTSETLAALLHAAANRWCDGSRLVTLPNVSWIDGDLTARAPARRMVGHFDCYLAVRDRHPGLRARCTNLEVV
jgi:GNAT superfamily N-acetyltransferase